MNKNLIRKLNINKINNKIINFGKFFLVLLPYVWFFLFFICPFIIILKISFAKTARTVPPYTNLINWNNNKEISITFNFENYLHIIKEDFIYLQAYIQSLKVASISTILCLLMSYPLAWALSQSKKSTRNFLLLFIILPSWTSFLIRIYSIIGFLDNNGILNKFLIFIHLIEEPLEIIYTNIAVYIGTVYCYLPFMVIPIYTSLINIKSSLVESALNLGITPIKTFFKVILPLTKKGIIAGIMFVFIPSLGEYVIPELLGGSDNIMIGRIIWQEFFNNHDWPAASAISVITLLIFIFPIILFSKYQSKD